MQSKTNLSELQGTFARDGRKEGNLLYAKDYKSLSIDVGREEENEGLCVKGHTTLRSEFGVGFKSNKGS